MQQRPLAQRRGQALKAIVREDQPAQSGRQGLSGNVAKMIAPETNLAERRAIPQSRRQTLETVAIAEQRAQPVKAAEIRRQVGEVAVADIKYLKRVGEAEEIAR